MSIHPYLYSFVSMCLSMCPSVCLPHCLPLSLSLSLPVSVCVSHCISVCPSFLVFVSICCSAQNLSKNPSGSWCRLINGINKLGKWDISETLHLLTNILCVAAHRGWFLWEARMQHCSGNLRSRRRQESSAAASCRRRRQVAERNED